ncbi:nuclear transport factor 2 family protein [Pontimicrobium aquaticum]|uniref:Nuclear transport factor 2 family protein n=1 Tax=Pontimicrobium aquaticum TaxID=2565367 RepID=A0A4U0EW54_9FLAO|nr:nuclear transport factor 2 family protein [Pontimicrobium aquaticum]TJY36070.1 nuclear transport factor 2 family protein [Pontimicrobium aquaticum]
MKVFKLLFLLFFFCISYQLQAQDYKCLKAINNQIWSNFTKAFETFDHDLFASLHSKDLVRVSGNSKLLRNKEDYINGYASRWATNKTLQTISFRFVERICNDNKASERGIYKLTINKDLPNEQSYYGKFHVIMIKENNQWKLLVDYDSSEGNTINQKTYNNAFAIDDLKKY